MIASVKFEEPLVLEVERAEALKLRYTVRRTGIRVGSSSSQRSVLGSHDYDVNDPSVVWSEEANEYFKEGEVIKSYYMYTNTRDDMAVIESGSHLVDLQWFVSHCKIPFTVIEAVPEANAASLTDLLTSMEKKLERVGKVFATDFNQKCDVHVGGGPIAQFNTLMLKEDACTDIIQGALNDGWRIIAVCVQPDQRRPDYVLGRYNPALSVAANAECKR